MLSTQTVTYLEFSLLWALETCERRYREGEMSFDFKGMLRSRNTWSKTRERC